MTYIKIKVKHLLIILVAVAALFTSAALFKSQILFMMGRISETAGNVDRAGVYYDRAAQTDLFSHTAIRSAQRKLELLIKEKNFAYFSKLTLEGGSTMFDCGYIGADSADRINRQYEKIAGGAQKDATLAEYTLYVAMVNYFAGNGEQAVELLDGLSYMKGTELGTLGELHQAAMNMGLGQMEKGYEVVQQELNIRDRYSVIRQEIAAYYHFMKDDTDGYKKMDVDPGEWYGATNKLDDVLLKPLLQIDNTLSGYANIVEINEKLSKKQNENSFHGKVTIDGKAAPYVIVYLKKTEYRNQLSSAPGIQNGILCAAVTAADGSFNIEHVPEGIYGIGVHVGWQRVQGRALLMDRNFSIQFDGDTSVTKEIHFIDTSDMVQVQDVGNGKLRFQVQMPEGAAFYTIQMGELEESEGMQWIKNNRFTSERIETEEFILDIPKERSRGMNTGASFSSDGIDPYYLFEPFYHTGEYVYYVTFNDKRGNILFDSSGIYPNRQTGTIHITGSPLSKADQLLLDKKYEEAILLYEKYASSEQQDLHALKVLTKLYYNGWEFDKEKFKLKNKDSIKAMAYFEILEKRIQDNEQVHTSLAWLYIDAGRYEEGLELLERSGNPYTLLQIAHVYGYMGDFRKAEEYYNQFRKATGQGADRLLMLYILKNKVELLPEMAALYIDNGSFYADYKPLIQDYLKLDKTGYDEFFKLIGENKSEEAAALLEGKKDDLARMYNALLLLQKRIPEYEEREARYREFYDEVKDPVIKKILQNFGKSGIQSMFGEE